MSGKGVRSSLTVDPGGLSKGGRRNSSPKNLGFFLSLPWQAAGITGPSCTRLAKQVRGWRKGDNGGSVSPPGTCHRLPLNYVFVCLLFSYCLAPPE